MLYTLKFKPWVSQNCPPGAVPLIAQVQDQCTSCPPTQFNLPYIVWAASLSMDTNLGMVPVSYRRVRSLKWPV